MVWVFFPEPVFLNPKENLELNILAFYYHVFRQERCKKKHLKQALQQLRSAYSKYSISNITSFITFESPVMRCAYLFNFASCFASVVAHHFHDVLFLNPRLLEKILLQDTLTLACLGGGPATELVAVAKALEDMLWWYCPRIGRPLKIYATIVDIDFGWKDTVLKVASSLKNMLDPSMIQYEVSFVQADLTQPLSNQVEEILERSEVVTMVKLLTAVNGSSGKKGVSNLLQNITGHILENSMLFFVDSSGFQHHDLLKDIMMSSDSMIQIYDYWEFSVHEMSLAFYLESISLYSKYFKPEMCCNRTKNYVSAWYRMPPWYT